MLGGLLGGSTARVDLLTCIRLSARRRAVVAAIAAAVMTAPVVLPFASLFTARVSTHAAALVRTGGGLSLCAG